MTWDVLKEYRKLIREENYSGSHMDRMIGAIAYLKRRFEFPELCTILVFPDFDEKIYEIYREDLSDTGARHFLTGVRKFRKFLIQKGLITEIENVEDLADHPADHFANYLREQEYNKTYEKNRFQVQSSLGTYALLFWNTYRLSVSIPSRSLNSIFAYLVIWNDFLFLEASGI